MATPLVTLQEIKDYLTITGTESDTALTVMANYVSQAIESYCGRTFTSGYVVEFHDGGRSSVFVDRLPVNNVNSVMEYDGKQYVVLTGPTSDDGELPNTEANANGAIDFAFYPDTGEFTRFEGEGSGKFNLDYRFPTTFSNYARGVRVEYNGGFDIIPGDLKMATLDFVKILHKQEQGVSTMAFQGESKKSHDLSADFPPHVRRILDLYRIW